MTVGFNPNGEWERREPGLREQLSLSAKDVFNGDVKRVLNNVAHATFNDTEAAQAANSLADMEIDVKGKDGKTTKEKVISANAFNQYVEQHFPNVDFNHVNNYISIVDATGSLTTYSVKQQAFDAAQQKAELEAKSQAEGGNGIAPEMGV